MTPKLSEYNIFVNIWAIHRVPSSLDRWLYTGHVPHGGMNFAATEICWGSCHCFILISKGCYVKTTDKIKNLKKTCFVNMPSKMLRAKIQPKPLPVKAVEHKHFAHYLLWRFFVCLAIEKSAANFLEHTTTISHAHQSDWLRGFSAASAIHILSISPASEQDRYYMIHNMY